MSDTHRIEFEALEYHADASVQPAHFSMEGSSETGWRIIRDGADHLSLGAGYVLLRTARCGVCSTDLSRQFLPFPLPQVTGHEVIAVDESGMRYAVEINASHKARGRTTACAFCRNGMATHCPERRVLGIHDLPGGFGPWLLVPENAALRVPDEMEDDTAVLIEPFAAALHAVQRIAIEKGDRIAVLGTRRLGLLAVAALAAHRRNRKLDYTLLGLSRHQRLQELAREFGADQAGPPPEPGRAEPVADIVIDTTGSPAGLELAIELAEREVHLKSTHGRPAAGLQHLTEAVVDEIGFRHFGTAAEAHLSELAHPESERPLVLWQSQSTPPEWLLKATQCIQERDSGAARDALRTSRESLPAADLVVVDGGRGVDRALRPWPDQQTGLVRPTGEIAVLRADTTDGPLVTALIEKNLRLSTSRCGDFRTALDMITNDPELAAQLPLMISHHLAADRLDEALRLAGTPDCLKVVVDHPILT
ncbi:MAG: alcohol dehydrogenase catalytic domain-containing protein [Myxococcota bacterium]